jgi:hypothetical protein
VTSAEALQYAGTELLTRDHIGAIDGLAERRWFGRCAILHDAHGRPEEIYFWGSPATELHTSACTPPNSTSVTRSVTFPPEH